MRETWFVMEDGSVGDPSEVAPDEKGVLRHKDGRAVAMRGDVPRSRGVDVEPQAKQMQPAFASGGYVTRETQAAPSFAPPKPDDTDMTALRAEYQAAFGKRPYLGWDAATLREKIASKAE